MKNIKIYPLIAAIAAVLVLAICLIHEKPTSQAKASEFGKYQGYSRAVYDGNKRISDYLTMPNGTRLAYDLFLPTKKGTLADKPLPVLFKYTPYGRAWTVGDKNSRNNLVNLGGMPWYYGPLLRLRCWLKGNLMDAPSRTAWLGEMLRSGYAVIVVDRPGTGASFGRLSMAPEAGMTEADAILDWVAAQKWCDGNIGMFGDSIQAQIQFQAAAAGNPHLKAILPATTWMDNYSAVLYPGGVLNKAFAGIYAKLNGVFDSLATPVDRDKDGVLLARARAERHNASVLAEQVRGIEGAAFRDFIMPDGENLWVDHQTLYPLLDRINRADVPVYLINGWYDIYARDDFLIYANLTVPKRLLVRPTAHDGIEAPGPDVDFAAEAHRWFDYWLKGIDNGIMREPPIHYYLQGAHKLASWQATQTWPPRNLDATRYYFGPGEIRGKASVNDGLLLPEPPVSLEAFDPYTVDYGTTTGKKPHWTSLATGYAYPNMRANDTKALTYTTPPLAAAVRVAGHPIVHAWLSTDAPDLDLFVYLEEVDGKGNSIYISQGNIRASHRALSPAPFDAMGLPWRNHFKSELRPIPAGEPVELVFDLLPTAYRFAKGNRLRITLVCADANNFATPVIKPAPSLRLLRDVKHPSFVQLPVVPEAVR